MPNPTLNDKEYNKFGQGDVGEVCIEGEVQSASISIPTGSLQDNEEKKFTTSGKMRVVLSQ